MDRRVSLLLVVVLGLGLVMGLMSCRRGGQGGNSVGPRPAPTGVQQGAQHPHELLTGETKATAMRGPRLSAVASEPVVRVRIARGTTSASFAGSATLTIGPGTPDRRRATARGFAGPVQVRHDGSGFVLTDARGGSIRWALSTLNISSATGEIVVDDTGEIAVDGSGFPGSVELVAIYDQGKYTGYFDIVNHVGMESYLPGVLSQEMYPKWDLEAYKAQAVAARSYAVWEMNLPVRTQSHFDLEAGQASQAYIGSKAHDTAKRAVTATRGLVLAYDGRVLPTFYSSCSGGVGQDATGAFPGRVVDLPPLRGRDQGAWGQQSSKFSWGPVSYPKPRLVEAMRRWGTAAEHPIAALRDIAEIRVTGHNAAGRPTGFAVIEPTGVRYNLDAEQLRVSANRPVPSDSPEQAARLKLWSSFVDITVLPDSVLFTGRGFGHGVGMCQFGAQGMATAGHRYNAILGFYYPGSRIQRAY